VWCRLLDGPVRDLNVMTRRRVFAHSLAVLEAVPGSSIHTGRLCFIHILRGGLAGAHRGDTIRIDDAKTYAIEEADAGTLLCAVRIRVA
jgi:environmental stress-induced protein Ves